MIASELTRTALASRNDSPAYLLSKSVSTSRTEYPLLCAATEMKVWKCRYLRL